MQDNKFILGSEWLYCKLYTGEKSADTLLRIEIQSMVLEVFDEKLADRWFFIRYHDDHGFHLRLRFHMMNTANLDRVINKIKDVFSEHVNTCLIKAIMYDTYNRETERYGSNTYQMTEEIFCADSDAVIEILSNIVPTISEDIRWRVALLMVDDMLNAFGLSLKEKHTFILDCRESFRREFGFIETVSIRQLNDKYRKNRNLIFRTMEENVPYQIRDILLKRKNRITDLAKPIMQILQVDHNSYISSLVHMSMNRLFCSQNRLCEMIIYDYLSRYYESCLARIKYGKI